MFDALGVFCSKSASGKYWTRKPCYRKDDRAMRAAFWTVADNSHCLPPFKMLKLYYCT